MVTKFIGVDKLFKLMRMIKENGGIWSSYYKLYRLYNLTSKKNCDFYFDFFFSNFLRFFLE